MPHLVEDEARLPVVGRGANRDGLASGSAVAPEGTDDHPVLELVHWGAAGSRRFEPPIEHPPPVRIFRWQLLRSLGIGWIHEDFELGTIVRELEPPDHARAQ